MSILGPQHKGFPSNDIRAQQNRKKTNVFKNSFLHNDVDANAAAAAGASEELFKNLITGYEITFEISFLWMKANTHTPT